METRHILQSAFITLVAAVLAVAQSAPRERASDRLGRMSDAEQVALAISWLDRGHPSVDGAEGLDQLARGRSALILPSIEAKIEEVLKAPNPAECFTNKGVPPDEVILYFSRLIARAGNRQALLEASKLLKIDEKRFDQMVEHTMIAAYSRDPFKLAYRGFEIGDPAIDKRLLAWAEKLLSEDLPHLGHPIFDKMSRGARLWAEALVDRHGGVPSPAQWMNDPIASHLGSIPEMALLEREVRRFAQEITEKRVQKK